METILLCWLCSTLRTQLISVKRCSKYCSRSRHHRHSLKTWNFLTKSSYPCHSSDWDILLSYKVYIIFVFSLFFLRQIHFFCVCVELLFIACLLLSCCIVCIITRHCIGFNTSKCRYLYFKWSLLVTMFAWQCFKPMIEREHQAVHLIWPVNCTALATPVVPRRPLWSH